MPATPTFVPASPGLVESPASPKISFESGVRTRTRIYEGKFSDAEAAALDTGTAGTDAEAGYEVVRCTVEKQKGERGRLTIEWRSAAVVLPPDEVAVAPGNASPRIELHNFFAPLKNNTIEISGESHREFAVARNAAAASTPDERKKWFNPLSNLGRLLVDKMERGNETFYLATLRYSWATHSFFAPLITRGGFIEDPSGPLKGYFVSDLQWLREGDDLQFSNGIWRRTSSWLGAPAGHWDEDLYA